MTKLPESKLTLNQKTEVTLQEAEPLVSVADLDLPDACDKLVLTLRYDDTCRNGHNTFSMVIEEYYKGRLLSGGCDHDAVRKHFPGFAYLIKWHLCSSDGPMHYIANTVYHAEEISKHQDKFNLWLVDREFGIKNLLGIHSSAQCDEIEKKYPAGEFIRDEWYNSLAKQPNLESARRSAIWPDATLEQLRDVDALYARLPELMQEFKADMESLGFTY